MYINIQFINNKYNKCWAYCYWTSPRTRSSEREARACEAHRARKSGRCARENAIAKRSAKLPCPFW